jgi:hypothetical protein
METGCSIPWLFAQYNGDMLALIRLESLLSELYFPSGLMKRYTMSDHTPQTLLIFFKAMVDWMRRLATLQLRRARA